MVLQASDIGAVTARLAEVEAAEEFADEEDVGASMTSGRSGEQSSMARVRGRGTQIGEAAESRANLQQAGLRARVGRKRIELVAADGAEQHGIAGEARLEGGGRKGRAGFADGDAADGSERKRKS